MPRARNKEDLLQFSEENYSKLLKMTSAMNENQLSTEFDFSDDAGKKEAHWGRDKNVRDVLIHLYEWHQLLIKFVEHNTAEENKIAFLPPEYSWKTYGEMNEKHPNNKYKTCNIYCIRFLLCHIINIFIVILVF